MTLELVYQSIHDSELRLEEYEDKSILYRALADLHAAKMDNELKALNELIDLRDALLRGKEDIESYEGNPFDIPVDYYAKKITSEDLASVLKSLE